MSVTISGSDHSRPHARVEGRFATVDFDLDDPRVVNWSNANAAILFDLLGVGEYQYGEAPLADVRRAIVRARATLERRGPHLERPETVTYGPPRENADGTIELRPVRVWSKGLNTNGMRDRLDAFERAVHDLARRGATHITWG
jgi:hypothetical protein